MSTSKFPRRHKDSAFRNVDDDGGIVVLPGQAQIKVLNPVGARIFALLDGRHSVDDLIQAVLADFDVDAETARADTTTFLDELEEQGLLSWETPEAATAADGEER